MLGAMAHERLVCVLFSPSPAGMCSRLFRVANLCGGRRFDQKQDAELMHASAPLPAQV